MNHIQPKLLFTSTLTLAIALLNLPVNAGEIVPSSETNTLVNQNGNLFTITGGESSLDGQNLFHKFPQFNLYLNEIADFQTNPNLMNLVVGVNGGSPSFIDGLIRLTGSNANFLLLNPSGIAFGKNASIDLPADLYLSTANKVGFSNGQFFDVLGENDYQNLLGNPESFIFDASQPSGIINEGNLKSAGNLSILAGGVISTGTIDGGNVTIQAIPGSSKFKVTPKGSFVSYEVELPRDESGNLKSFTLYDLTEILLAQNSLSNEISFNEDGTLQVNDINIPNENGLNVLSGNINTSSIDGIGGDIKVLGEKISVIGNSQLDASGEMGGGNINIGGSFQGKGELQNAQSTFVGNEVFINASALTTGDGGDVIIWADNRTDFWGSLNSRGGEISGNGGFAEISGKNDLIFRGNLDLGTNNGEIGTVLFDPVNIEISNQPTATFLESNIENGSIANLNFEATNNIVFGSLDDNLLFFPASNIDISFIANSDNTGGGDIIMPTNILFKASSLAGNTQGRSISLAGDNISLGNFDTGSGISGTQGNGIPAPGGSIIINATGDIQTGNLDVFADSDQTNNPRIPNIGNSGNIVITTSGGSITTGTLSANAAEGSPGDITLQAEGNILVTGNLEVGTVFAEGGSGGDITLISRRGAVQVDGLIGSTTGRNDFTGEESIGGNILINAFDSLKLNGSRISTAGRFTTSPNSKSGDIILMSQTGNIELSDTIRTSAVTGRSGNIKIFAPQGEITLNELNTSTPDNLSGNIEVNGIGITLNGNLELRGNNNNSNGNVILSGDIILANSISVDSNNILFIGTINSLDNSQFLTLNTSGDINFLNALGTTNPIAGLNIIGNQVNIVQNITTNGNIVFNALANIQGNSVISAGANNIALNNGLTTNAAITLEADTLNLLGSFIGSGNILNIRPASLGQNITIGSEVANTLSISDTELVLFDGFRQVAIGRNDGSGNISITNNVTVQDPLLLQTSTGLIIVDGNTTGVDDASITLNAPTIFLNADLISNNRDITINGNTNLGADVNVDTGTGAGNIVFNGSITGVNQTLNTRSGLGETTLGNPVLAFDINLNTASNVNLAGDLTITNPNGKLEFNNPTTLTNNANLTTAGSDITNNNTINSQTGTNFNLGINLAGGSFTNNAAIGGVQPVGNVVINNAQNAESNAPIEVLSFTINNANKVTLNNNLTANASNVDITANNNITTTDITTNGGDINLVSNTGNILTGNLNSSNAGGTGGNVTAIALGNPNSSITTNNINSSGNIGGNVNLQAIKAVTTNEIFARGTIGNGGNVTIDPVNVIVNFIDAQGGAFGTGGNVDITATEFFRATGGFVDDTGIFSSISTTGGAGSGSITIRHAGGDLLTPFIVGDPSINGTAGALNTGAFTIAPYGVFPGSYYFGNISIITSDRFQNELNKATNIRIPELEPAVEIEDNGFFIDEYFTRIYERYFENNPLADQQRIKSLDEIKDELAAVEEATGVKPALIYALFQPKLAREGCIEAEQVNSPDLITEVLEGDLEPNEKESCLTSPLKFQEAEDDILTLIMVTSDQPAKVAIVPDATRKEIEQYALKFSGQSRNSASKESRKIGNYYSNSQLIYDWLITPLKEYFKQDEKNTRESSISNLTFIVDSNLRSIPFAALVDSSQSDDLCKEGDIDSCAFIIEDYSVGLMPSMSLTDTKYQNLTSLNIRLGGVAKVSGHRRLRLMEKQLETIAGFWGENSENTLQGQNFTYENLQTRQEDRQYGIIHLGTHAKFLGEKEPYIAFASKDVSSEEILLQSNLGLQDIRNIKLKGVNLLTLNACETALGDENAELGFAGFAHRAEARSVLGSLWLVSEHSTNALMLNFYREFFDSSSKDYVEGEEQAMPIKAESLRQAQLNLLTGKTRIADSQTMVFSPKLNPNISNTIDIADYCQRYSSSCPSEFKDPYYWSGFTIIGNPW